MALKRKSQLTTSYSYTLSITFKQSKISTQAIFFLQTLATIWMNNSPSFYDVEGIYGKLNEDMFLVTKKICSEMLGLPASVPCIFTNTTSAVFIARAIWTPVKYTQLILLFVWEIIL